MGLLKPQAPRAGRWRSRAARCACAADSVPLALAAAQTIGCSAAVAAAQEEAQGRGDSVLPGAELLRVEVPVGCHGSVRGRSAGAAAGGACWPASSRAARGGQRCRTKARRARASVM